MFRWLHRFSLFLQFPSFENIRDYPSINIFVSIT